MVETIGKLEAGGSGLLLVTVFAQTKLRLQ
jgi:hypothetical protein